MPFAIICSLFFYITSTFYSWSAIDPITRDPTNTWDRNVFFSRIFKMGSRLRCKTILQSHLGRYRMFTSCLKSCDRGKAPITIKMWFYSCLVRKYRSCCCLMSLLEKRNLSILLGGKLSAQFRWQAACGTRSIVVHHQQHQWCAPDQKHRWCAWCTRSEALVLQSVWVWVSFGLSWPTKSEWAHLADICDDEDDEYNDGDGRLLPGGFVGWLRWWLQPQWWQQPGGFVGWESSPLFALPPRSQPPNRSASPF